MRQEKHLEQHVERVEHVRQASPRALASMSGDRPFVGDRLLTVSEVADMMRVSNMTVYRLIKSGQLPAVRVGKNYRIREADVDRYLAERVVGR